MTDLSRLSRLALLGLALASPGALQGQGVDTVRISVTPEGATIEQRLAPESGAVEAFALLIAGQTLEVTDVVREGTSLLDVGLSSDERAYRLDVASGAPITLRYSVTGSTERIPLFVAGGRAEVSVVTGVESPYLLRFDGPEELLGDLDLSISSPRFRGAADGALEVELSSLPGLVRLSQGGFLSFARLADTVVVLLIVFAAVWTWRNARVRKVAGAAKGASAGGDAP